MRYVKKSNERQWSTRWGLIRPRCKICPCAIGLVSLLRRTAVASGLEATGGLGSMNWPRLLDQMEIDIML